MKQYLSLILMLMCSLSTSQVIEAKECQENINFSFDNRDWVQGFEENNEEASIVEYTLKGETVDKWSELVTVQRFAPFSISVEEYYRLFIKNLNQAIAPDEVKSRIINKSDNDIFFEWWIDGNDPQTQHEWFRLFKTPQSTTILRYTTKKLNDVEKMRPVWEKNLSNAKVIDDCAKKGVGILK